MRGNLPSMAARSAFGTKMHLSRPWRPLNLALYGEPDAAGLAASLAFGIARNHPFADGNKRSAWVGARLFMRWNGIELKIIDAEATAMVQSLAAGQLTEDEVAAWLRERIV